MFKNSKNNYNILNDSKTSERNIFGYSESEHIEHNIINVNNKQYVSNDYNMFDKIQKQKKLPIINYKCDCVKNFDNIHIIKTNYDNLFLNFLNTKYMDFHLIAQKNINFIINTVNPT